MNSPAYRLVQNIYANANSGKGHSWRILNGALSSALSTAVTAHLDFNLKDFAAICKDFNGGYWLGDGNGSHLGEGFYSSACSAGNTSACLSFEDWAKRPAALWAEETKTPKRLHVGADFTLAGQTVRVTSMRQSSLVACAYGDYDYDGFEVGSIHHLDTYRKVEAILKQPDDTMLLRMSAPVSNYHESRTILKRFTVTYEELAKSRKTYDDKRRSYEKQLATATTHEAVHEISDRAAAEGRRAFRHFDIELLQEAIVRAGLRITKGSTDAENRAWREKEQRCREVAQAARLNKWLAGEDVPGWFAGPVRLRVNGNRVETSTGQSATVIGVREALEWVMPLRRKKTAVLSGKQVDLHPVTMVSSEGVQVGCTLVPWPEVEAVAKHLCVVSTGA